MTKRHILLCALVAAVAVPYADAAPPQRTFVASNGVDAAACTRTAPCRNFGAAVAAVAAGGEMIVLDSELSALNCSSNHNGQGFAAQGADTVMRVSSSAAIDNADFGFVQLGASVFQSFGNNTVAGNGAATNGTISSVSPQ